MLVDRGIYMNEDPPNNRNFPDHENYEDAYLAAILKTDLLEACGKIDYNEIFAIRDKRLNKNGNS